MGITAKPYIFNAISPLALLLHMRSTGIILIFHHKLLVARYSSMSIHFKTDVAQSRKSFWYGMVLLLAVHVGKNFNRSVSIMPADGLTPSLGYQLAKS